MTERKEYLIGYLAGFILGISMRNDVPEDIRTLCKDAYDKYKKEYGDET